MDYPVSDDHVGSHVNWKIEPEQLPPGFRFEPTDEELVNLYLLRKVLNNQFSICSITEVDLNHYEPWELPERAQMGEKECYFFAHRDKKYPRGSRANRATKAGYWKATGKDRHIRSNSCRGVVAGMKKTLVFYKGRAPKGEKTNWVMHEYRLEGHHHLALQNLVAEWILCRVFRKIPGGKKAILKQLINPNHMNISKPNISLPHLLESPLQSSSNHFYMDTYSDVQNFLQFDTFPRDPLLGAFGQFKDNPEDKMLEHAQNNQQSLNNYSTCVGAILGDEDPQSLVEMKNPWHVALDTETFELSSSLDEHESHYL